MLSLSTHYSPLLPICQVSPPPVLRGSQLPQWSPSLRLDPLPIYSHTAASILSKCKPDSHDSNSLVTPHCPKGKSKLLPWLKIMTFTLQPTMTHRATGAVLSTHPAHSVHTPSCPIPPHPSGLSLDVTFSKKLSLTHTAPNRNPSYMSPMPDEPAWPSSHQTLA